MSQTTQEETLCGICHQKVPLSAMLDPEVIDEEILEHLQDDHADWDPEEGCCDQCVADAEVEYGDDEDDDDDDEMTVDEYEED